MDDIFTINFDLSIGYINYKFIKNTDNTYNIIRTQYLMNFKKNNGGKTGAVGDYYFFDLIVKRSNDSIINNSYESAVPAKFLRRKSLYPGDIYEAFSMCAEGDSLTIVLLADSFYNSHNFPFPEYLIPG